MANPVILPSGKARLTGRGKARLGCCCEGPPADCLAKLLAAGCEPEELATLTVQVTPCTPCTPTWTTCSTLSRPCVALLGPGFAETIEYFPDYLGLEEVGCVWRFVAHPTTCNGTCIGNCCSGVYGGYTELLEVIITQSMVAGEIDVYAEWRPSVTRVGWQSASLCGCSTLCAGCGIRGSMLGVTSSDLCAGIPIVINNEFTSCGGTQSQCIGDGSPGSQPDPGCWGSGSPGAQKCAGGSISILSSP